MYKKHRTDEIFKNKGQSLVSDDSWKTQNQTVGKISKFTRNASICTKGFFGYLVQLCHLSYEQ